jgi:hypothetical protein
MVASLSFPSVPQGNQTGWDVPLKNDITGMNADIETLKSAVALLSPGPTASPFGSLVNVKDYGATGNGATDDTTAIINARNAVLGSTVNGGNCTKTLYFPAGIYRVTQPGCIVDSPNAAGAAQAIIGSFRVMGDGKRVSEIFFDYAGTAAAGKHPGSISPFVMGNRVNRLRVSNIRLRSANGTNTGFFFWSRDNGDTTFTYPEYGSGNNQDIRFEEIEFAGAWRWGVLCDGDQQTNLNSEFFLKRINTTNATTFAGALFQVGYTNWQANGQQDQMVNYVFDECKFEYLSGDCLVFNRGGFLNCRGGSWILGIADATAKVGGVFFKTGDVTAGHNASTMQATFNGIRLELRHENCKFFDVAWYGNGAHITIDNCADTANSFLAFGPLVSSIVRVHSGSLPSLRIVNSTLGGFIQVLGAQTSTTIGRIVLDQTGFYNYPTGGIGTIAAANTFLRYDTATVPKYRYRDCPNVVDAAN